jgi:hypothetical protein
MGKVRRSTTLGLTLLLLSVAGCKVSCTTANISGLKFSKDEKGTTQTKEFAPADTIYAIATVSNNSSKVTLKFSLFAEKVEGMAENSLVPNSEQSIEVTGSGSQPLTLRWGGGWPPGRYRVEVVMLYSGDQKDKKSDTFTVTGGGGGGGAPPTSPAATPSSTGGETPEEDDNDSEDSSPDK